ncbi:unnamed protein product [Rotaria sordida]|uniref:MULE transposase domain-containing protein n=1 Tax=Rotaria sordida TaxID=392033 RepID=A0A819HUC6_9BILA|nr:unnamed protein product [Rotaria sordida]CAF3903554.1 unnamed protein product [Rotaria sordida]
MPTEHTCKSDAISFEQRKFDERIAHRAHFTQEASDLIVTDCYKNMTDQAIACLPACDNVKRRIRMLRQNKHVIATPNDLNFESIPTSLTKTIRLDQFLRCDTGPSNERILIFASTEQFNILQSTTDFLINGTFKVVPVIFYQRYIIHAIYRGHVVPVAYVLLRRKNGATYNDLVDRVLEFAPHWTPDSIMLDFEQACIGAYDTSFPDALLSDCYFHFRQNLHRKLQSLGHQNKYNDDSVFAHNIHKLAALAFLKPDDVVKGFEALSLTLDDDDDYQNGYVLGRLRANLIRRKLTFSIEFWNMYNRTMHSLMRTNNAVEAYHRRIGSIFQCAHPTLWVFLQKLIDEENATHADIVQIRAGQPPKITRNSERFEKRLINLISNPHQDILTQIDSLAHNISL